MNALFFFIFRQDTNEIVSKIDRSQLRLLSNSFLQVQKNSRETL